MLTQLHSLLQEVGDQGRIVCTQRLQDPLGLHAGAVHDALAESSKNTRVDWLAVHTSTCFARSPTQCPTVSPVDLPISARQAIMEALRPAAKANEANINDCKHAHAAGPSNYITTHVKPAAKKHAGDASTSVQARSHAY